MSEEEMALLTAEDYAWAEKLLAVMKEAPSPMAREIMMDYDSEIEDHIGFISGVLLELGIIEDED